MPPKRKLKSAPLQRSPSVRSSTASGDTSSLQPSNKTTPPTSHYDKDEANVDAKGNNARGSDKRRITRSGASSRVSSASSKRTRSMLEETGGDDQSDDEKMETESTSVRASKRRAVTREVYVELPQLGSLRKGKGRATSSTLSTPTLKGKRRVSSRTAESSKTSSPLQDDPEDDLVDAPSELEYPEDEDESGDDDGSAYENSDDDEPNNETLEALQLSDSDEASPATRSPSKNARSRRAAGRRRKSSSKVQELDEQADSDTELVNVMAVDEEDEAAMLTMAVAASLAESNSVSKPSGASSSRQSAASRQRARAAEKRLKSGSDDDAEDAYLSTEPEASSSEDDSSDNGGGFIKETKATGKRVAKVADTSKPRKMTLAQLRAQKREAKKAAESGNSSLRALEKAERKALGRKLTHAEKSSVALKLHHPELKDVWGDLEKTIEIIQPQKAAQPEGLKVTLLPFQQESLHWMRKQELGIWHGGCLADEMGMGKTIQTLALMVSDRRKPNLIVAPTVAIMQWKNEIEAHTTGFKVSIYHGSSREKDYKEIQKNDIVLTTYSVLESAYRKQHTGFKRKGDIVKEASALHRVKWARIVLDEAHNIKERSCNTAKATFQLQSDFKWCLSGTPLQNRVGELYSLVRFLGGDPFSYYFCKACPCKSLHWSFKDKRTCDECGHSPMRHTCFWNNEILTPIQKHGMVGPGASAFKKLKILLDRMMLRRTKLERADDLGLPPRTVIVRKDYFSPEEKELYLSLFSDAKRQFSTYADSGTVLNNYSNIFSLITRMRQMACHPDLVLKSKRNTAMVGEIEESTVCRLCNDFAEDAIKSKCHHIFDRECIKQYLNTAVEQCPDCPVCHVPLSIDLEGPALEQDEELVSKARQGILGRLDLDSWRSSSKIEALVEELSNLRRDDRTTKSIVFSQFVNFLDLIAWRLQRAGFIICRLEGTMSPQARDATIKHFMNNVEVTVFLVSLKAGGVALNLVEASRVYLMDSWWNPAVEYQAMDRIHRLGQHRPVKAIKLVIEDSIESRIVQLQEKKTAMVDATLSSDDSAMGRLTPEDLGFLFRL